MTQAVALLLQVAAPEPARTAPLDLMGQIYLNRQAWLEAEEAIADVREARRRWRASGRVPGFEAMARMLELAFKLKQFASGLPSETKEIKQTVGGSLSLEWEDSIRKAFGMENGQAIVDVPSEPVRLVSGGGVS